MTRRYFGTDGVRGKVGEAPITPDFVMRLGYAAGKVLVKRARRPGTEHPAVLIGKDTRISGYMLEASLEAGLSAAGVDVMLTGPLPTPAVAYLTRALRLQAGIVISASHNPFEDNGIKFFSSDGAKLPDEIETEIEAEMVRSMRCTDSAHLGRARRIDDAAGRYIEFCKSTFPSTLDLRGMKIAVDCANGAAYHIAPHVLHELGAEVVPMGVSPDGFNINANIGATSPEALQVAVRRQGCDLGIALDGDGDRVVMADARGKLFDGDQLLYVIAGARSHRTRKLTGVAGTLMTNLALERAFDSMGVPFARARVGDRYVLELMIQKGWQLGGENSGHIICLDKHTTGDGIVTALQVLAAIRNGRSTLGSLCKDLKLFPQVLTNVRVPRGYDWQKKPVVVKAKAAAEKALGQNGRVLLRPSGTEAVLRVMVEGKDRDGIRTIAADLARAVECAR